MEIVDIVAKAHFEDSRVGAVARKQRLRVARPLAEYLESLGLVDFVNPTQAVVIQSPKTEPESLGGDEPLALSPPAQASQEQTATVSRRGRRKKAGEYSL
jgi:hypothetical protein